MPLPLVKAALRSGFNAFLFLCAVFAVLTLWLFASAKSEFQMELSLVIGVLGFFLSVAVAVLQVLTHLYRWEKRKLNRMAASVHYPLRHQFMKRSGLEK